MCYVRSAETGVLDEYAFSASPVTPATSYDDVQSSDLSYLVSI